MGLRTRARERPGSRSALFVEISGETDVGKEVLPQIRLSGTRASRTGWTANSRQFCHQSAEHGGRPGTTEHAWPAPGSPFAEEVGDREESAARGSTGRGEELSTSYKKLRPHSFPKGRPRPEATAAPAADALPFPFRKGGDRRRGAPPRPRMRHSQAAPEEESSCQVHRPAGSAPARSPGPSTSASPPPVAPRGLRVRRDHVYRHRLQWAL